MSRDLYDINAARSNSLKILEHVNAENHEEIILEILNQIDTAFLLDENTPFQKALKEKGCSRKYKPTKPQLCEEIKWCPEILLNQPPKCSNWSNDKMYEWLTNCILNVTLKFG